MVPPRANTLSKADETRNAVSLLLTQRPGVSFENKNSPTSLIDSIPQKDGTAGSRNKITAHPDGVLVRSKWFQQTCESNVFKPDTHETEIDFEHSRGDVPLAL
jgi:hypothetical protein